MTLIRNFDTCSAKFDLSDRFEDGTKSYPPQTLCPENSVMRTDTLSPLIQANFRKNRCQTTTPLWREQEHRYIP